MTGIRIVKENKADGSSVAVQVVHCCMLVVRIRTARVCSGSFASFRVLPGSVSRETSNSPVSILRQKPPCSAD